MRDMVRLGTKTKNPISDSDIDSLSVLPLGVLPVETQGLRSVRMVKDTNLQSAIEMFTGQNVGTGLIYPDSLHDQFPHISSDDYTIIRTVGELQSFDVYNLRIALRNMGIEVDKTEHLCLSSSKQQELQFYIRPFIKKLVQRIYGDDNDKDISIQGIATLFHDPDVSVAREKLKNIADCLSIPLTGVPQFLADYGDIYLSVAYYRQCLDVVRPTIEDFISSANEIRKHPQIKHNAEIIRVCTRLENKFLKLQKTLSSHFEIFNENTEEMWEDMSVEKFAAFKNMVESNHSVLGSFLCALTVKMTLWKNKFPTRHVAGPSRHVDFIMTDMRQGI